MYGRIGCEIKTIGQGERRKKSHRVTRVGILQENVGILKFLNLRGS
jgi:hypothetical protein